MKIGTTNNDRKAVKKDEWTISLRFLLYYTTTWSMAMNL